MEAILDRFWSELSLVGDVEGVAKRLAGLGYLNKLKDVLESIRVGEENFARGELSRRGASDVEGQVRLNARVLHRSLQIVLSSLLETLFVTPPQPVSKPQTAPPTPPQRPSRVAQERERRPLEKDISNRESRTQIIDTKAKERTMTSRPSPGKAISSRSKIEEKKHKPKEPSQGQQVVPDGSIRKVLRGSRSVEKAQPEPLPPQSPPVPTPPEQVPLPLTVTEKSDTNRSPEDEFSKRLAMSVKKKLLGNTPTLDVHTDLTQSEFLANQAAGISVGTAKRGLEWGEKDGPGPGEYSLEEGASRSVSFGREARKPPFQPNTSSPGPEYTPSRHFLAKTHL